MARKAAQTAPLLNPPLIQGVITLDTPNTGALIDYTGQAALADAISQLAQNQYNDAGCSSPFDSPWCFLADVFYNFSLPIVQFAFNTAFPDTADLQIGSPFLSSLNSASENFIRVGINSVADKRWNLPRLIGDAFCNPEDGCGGRAFALYTEIAYDVLYAIEIITLLECEFGCYCDWYLFEWAVQLQYDMDYVDGFWNNLTSAGNDTSDGLIQGSSQTYPAIPGPITQVNYVVQGSDSHTGVTKSDRTKPIIEQALASQFGVPQAGCTYSISSSTANFGPAGGTTSFTVSTGPVCVWATTSTVPWATVSPSGTATGTGTVTVTVFPNLSGAARSGTLNTPGAVFTMSQSGATGATGLVTVQGYEQRMPLDPNCCPRGINCLLPVCNPPGYLYDFGTVSITVNSVTSTVSYGRLDSTYTLASKLAAAINTTSTTSLVSAAAANGQVYMFANTSGPNTNYPFSSADTFDSGDFSGPSFTLLDSGPTLTGGH